MADFVECASCHRNVAAGLTWCPFCGEVLTAAPEFEEGGDDAFLDEADLFADEPAAPGDDPEDTEPGADPDTCSACARPLEARLRWCPHCGTERAVRAEAPPLPFEEVLLPPPDLGDMAAPDVLDEAPPDLPPPPPPRRADAPLGVESSRPVPDLDSETRRVRRSQIAGMVMSIVLIIGSVTFVVFLLVSLFGGDDDPATQGTTPSDVFTTFTPVVGDCVGYQRDGEITEEPCDEPHHGEVFANPLYVPTETAYPGDEAIVAFAADRCSAAFEDYVGVDYYASGLTFTYVTPGAEGWADGARRVLCLLEDPFGATVSVRLRNSGGVDHPGYVPFSRLTGGICWDFTLEAGELVPVVDCAAPHDVETFAAFDYPADDFPGDAAAQELGAQECSRRLADYAGEVDPAIDYWAATPTESDWPRGYRVVVCSAYRPDGVKLTGSLAG